MPHPLLIASLFIPSPPWNGFSLGPLRIHFYALCIMTGIAVAWWLSTRRFVARGGDSNVMETIVVVAVVCGIIGARAYHVATDPELYFTRGRDPWRAFAIWEGGLGIWGAIAGGALGAWWVARRHGLPFGDLIDVLAPGILIAQALGRLGNWFNQELFGGPTTLPWGLQIDDAHLPAGYASGTLFHPTFLYELLWNLAAAGVLIWLDRRFKLGHGRVFALYVVLYTSGRLWIELLRIDPAHTIGPFRLNVWTSIVVGLGALVAFLLISRRHHDRETTLLRDPPAVQGDEETAPEVTR
jgi:prolipoprotein diacylglyceryl transferase